LSFKLSPQRSCLLIVAAASNQSFTAEHAENAEKNKVIPETYPFSYMRSHNPDAVLAVSHIGVFCGRGGNRFFAKKGLPHSFLLFLSAFSAHSAVKRLPAAENHIPPGFFSLQINRTGRYQD